MRKNICQSTMDQLFDQTRTYSGWLDKPVDDALLNESRVR